MSGVLLFGAGFGISLEESEAVIIVCVWGVGVGGTVRVLLALVLAF